ncbi:hypothetical protein DRE_07396 [Drechslerella stenobrocha 248]|uniref:Uncharacterized protein n=1 Tax=Drechslerella stenobrocha 248 TaxID=1043628 RepID=W7HIL7_9PEZI|nr:hypothetical protein DRE_07396 [Drechslerella stenobrocha 248]
MPRVPALCCRAGTSASASAFYCPEFSDPQPAQRSRSAASHSNASHISASPDHNWSIGSPALSITSVDPASPSLRFKDRPTESDCHIDVDGSEWTADVRRKASNYLQYVESLSQAYESQLKALCAFFKDCDAGRLEHRTYTDAHAVQIIEVNRDGSRNLIGINEIEALVDYFGEQEYVDSPANQIVSSRVFLLDRITPELIGVFGAKLGVEPQFWDAHLTLAGTESNSPGQILRYGNEQGSRVSFLNIPLLRRCSSLEAIDKVMENATNKPESSSPPYEGCSIHLDSNSDGPEATSVLIMTNDSGGHLRYCSGSLRASFVDHLMAMAPSVAPLELVGEEHSDVPFDTTIPLMIDLIKAIIHQLGSTLDSIPDHAKAEMSTFTINVFKDESDQMRQSILEEQDIISSLSRTLKVSLVAFDEVATESEGNARTSKVVGTLEPLLQDFEGRSDRMQQWLRDLDSTVLNDQRERAARLRRLKTTLSVCSLSLAMTIIVVIVTQLQANSTRGAPTGGV